MEKTFAIHTIGCKLNQFESEWIRQALQRRQWVVRRFEESAQFYIINSCTVTGKSDARCRNAVRRARRHFPQAFIIVTGCYAETQPDKLDAMGEVDLVVGNREKATLPAIMEELASPRSPATALGTGSTPSAFVGEEEAIDCFLDHSRAFIKIQEGCDASCSYCIIPRARGPSRSIPVDAVRRQVSLLAGRGYREIVLTGIHLGRYGADLTPPRSLVQVIETLMGDTDGVRFRLSSIEVTEVTRPLIELVRQGSRLAPHFHVPLQSGDDSVLGAMNRPYDTALFRERIEEIAGAAPRVGIGTDIIVGFPGETTGCFERTVELVRALPLSYFHVFSFSPRPGTLAADMPGQVSPDDKKRRSTRLIELGRRKKRAFLKAQIGTVHEALIQGRAHPVSPFSRALTGNYCEVLVEGALGPSGALAPVRITHYGRGTLYGSGAGDGRAPETHIGETSE